MTLAMSGATPADAGLASGLVNTTVQVGGAVGLAVLATLATERTEGLVAGGEAQMAALNAGFHLAYVVGAALLAAALVIAATVLRPEGEAQPATAGTEPEREARHREPVVLDGLILFPQEPGRRSPRAAVHPASAVTPGARGRCRTPWMPRYMMLMHPAVSRRPGRARRPELREDDEVLRGASQAGWCSRPTA